MSRCLRKESLILITTVFLLKCLGYFVKHCSTNTVKPIKIKKCYQSFTNHPLKEILLNSNRTNKIHVPTKLTEVSFWGESSHSLSTKNILSAPADSQGLKRIPQKHRKRKRAKAHSIDLSTQPYFDTLQGRSSPNVPNWGLTSTGAEQILASWVALGPVIYLHPIEPLSSPLLPQLKTPRGVREPAWTLHTDGWRRLSFPLLTSTYSTGFYNNRWRVRNRLEASVLPKHSWVHTIIQTLCNGLYEQQVFFSQR